MASIRRTVWRDDWGGALFEFDLGRGGGEAFGFGGEGDGAGLAAFGFDDGEGEAVEGFALGEGEDVHIVGIAIVGSDDFAGAGDFEGDVVVGAGDHEAILVGDSESDEGEVVAVAGDGVAVGFELKLGGGGGGFDGVGGPLLAVLVGDDFEFAGLVFHIVPADTVGGLAVDGDAVDDAGLAVVAVGAFE